jgi:hypothetical protein
VDVPILGRSILAQYSKLHPVNSLCCFYGLDYMVASRSGAPAFYGHLLLLLLFMVSGFVC